MGYVVLMNGSDLMGSIPGFFFCLSWAISIMIHLCSCLLVPHNLLIDFRYMKVFRMFRLFMYLHVSSCLLCCIYNAIVVYFEERRIVDFCKCFCFWNLGCIWVYPSGFVYSRECSKRFPALYTFVF